MCAHSWKAKQEKKRKQWPTDGEETISCLDRLKMHCSLTRTSRLTATSCFLFNCVQRLWMLQKQSQIANRIRRQWKCKPERRSDPHLLLLLLHVAAIILLFMMMTSMLLRALRQQKKGCWSVIISQSCASNLGHDRGSNINGNGNGSSRVSIWNVKTWEHILILSLKLDPFNYPFRFPFQTFYQPPPAPLRTRTCCRGIDVVDNQRLFIKPWWVTPARWTAGLPTGSSKRPPSAGWPRSSASSPSSSTSSRSPSRTGDTTAQADRDTTEQVNVQKH